MTTEIETLYAWAWPGERAGEAVESLAREARLLPYPEPASLRTSTAETAWAEEEGLPRRIEHIASQLGIEVEPVEAAFIDVDRLVRGAAPAILRLPPAPTAAGVSASCFLALLKGGARRVSVLAPDLSVKRLPVRALRDVLCYPVESPYVAATDEVLRWAGVPEDRLPNVRRAALAEQLSAVRVGGGWLLRLSPAAPLWRQARQTGLYSPLLVVFAANIVQQVLLILSWWLIGRSALEGHFDPAGLWAWALLLLTGVPLQMMMNSAAGAFAAGLGGLFKQRLLFGILKLNADETRHQGLGQFLGRVMDTEAVELLALGGGFSALVAVTQLVTAAWVLSSGAGGGWHAALLGLWALLTLAVGWRYLAHSLAWVEAYRAMTNDLVERMVGHRTRLVQEERARWHVEEDSGLDRYLKLSERLDRTGVFVAVIPRAWVVAALAGLAYAFASGIDRPALLAVSLGGVLLASQALNSIVAGLQNVVAVAQAWGQVGPLFRAAARPDERPAVLLDSGRAPETEANGRPTVLSAKEITFHYRDRGAPALAGCTLQIRRGDRLLLEGPSGGGKSTLAAALAGLRPPASGLLLLSGYDRPSVGADAWRRRVAVAPQFHENHIFSETLAFNLLMGRRWPPTGEDLREAEALCRDLGLGELLERMPSGLQQIVGESGWQLSHGERSRLYIARALLQGAEIVILDESFGVLDPENLSRALDCALRRASTLLVIAHP